MSLTDSKLKNAKPRERRYKLNHANGLYAEVLPSGSISFRFQYWRNGKREKVTLGRYPECGLKEAKKRHGLALAELDKGVSPAREKQRRKDAATQAQTVSEFIALWLKKNDARPTWRNCQQLWINKDILPALGNRKLVEVTAVDVLQLLDSIKTKRGAAQSALRVRGILSQLFDFAVGRQAIQVNPVKLIRAKDVATPKPRKRVIQPAELKVFFERLETFPTSEANRITFKLLLLTMVRKTELIGAKWSEIDLDEGTWIIPATRMKMGTEHVVPLCHQTVTLFKRLKFLSGESEWVLPSAFDIRKPMGDVTLNGILYSIERQAVAEGGTWERFTLHDFRRCASTFLHERGYQTDTINKQLSHEKRSVSTVYNRAEWLPQRRIMLAAWADLIDAWLEGRKVKMLTLAASR